MNDWAIDISCCRARQRRLLEVMERLNVDLVIVARNEHVQWLTGVYYSPLYEPLAALHSDGTCTLVAPNREPHDSAADRIRVYDAQWLATLRNDQRQAAAEELGRDLANRSWPRWVGVEYSLFGPHLAGTSNSELVDIEPDLFVLRRKKEADELARIRHAISATEAMYLRAREVIRPGVNELDVYSELQAAAVRALGEPSTAHGNDFACGVPGGPPRDRNAQAGELYILDLGPAFRGYYADNCRTIAVDRKPSDEQQRAWQAIADIFPLVERIVQPGVRCREVYFEVKEILDEYLPDAFSHHLGHGIGLYPHEAPHLNPNWNDTFEVGDVFTVEPGLYSDELRGGIRLEQNYVVTESGVERLTDFPLELVV